jgi:hypothetical protein
MSLPEFSLEFNLASLRANLDLAVAQRLVKPFDVDTHGLEALSGCRVMSKRGLT